MLLCMNSYGQEFYKQEVIKTTLSKEDMFKNIKQWLFRDYSDAKQMLSLEDKESGTMIIKCQLHVNSSGWGTYDLAVNNTITLEIKDNRFRYTAPYGTVYIDATAAFRGSQGKYTLENRIRELELIMDVSNKYFNSMSYWVIDDKYDDIIEEYVKKRDAIPAYKDKKKTKLDPEWEKAMDNVSLLERVKDVYYTKLDKFVSDLIHNAQKEIVDF